MRTILACLLFLATCTVSAQESTILENKDKIVISKLDSLNSDSKDCNLCISPNGRHLYFMSARGGQKWSRYRDSSVHGVRYDGDIWLSVKEGGEWQSPKCLGDGVNSYHGEDEPMISQTGRSISFQSWKSNWKTNGGPYYEATLFGTKFMNVKGLGGGINKFFVKNGKKRFITNATDGASMSRDGKIFIVCCGGNYEGNMDIYMSRKIKGEWGKMKKLAISTPGDERSAFISHDGKTIYFASDGYKGFGGLDIYKVVMDEKGEFGEVINIGAPFNTRADDRGFIVSNSGDEGYFVRDGDIYYANLEKADEQLKPNNLEKLADEIIVSGKNIKIIYWDSSQEDGDIISLTVDGEYILKNQALINKKQEADVILKNEINDLVLHAENEGNSPANTASIIIDDGTTRHRIRLRSDAKTSETVRITVVE